jgi:DNA-binding IclR family transcriptional regulator
MSAPTGNRTSRSLVYGLNLLRLFTPEQPIRGIAELAEQMSVSRPTAHRYASTCLELGYLEQAAMRRYRLARRSAWPGMALIDSLAITRCSRSILRELREQTGRTVSHAVLDGTNVLYLQRLCGYERGQYRLERRLGAGTRMPAQVAAAGQALLAAAASEVEGREPQWTGHVQLTIRDGGLHDGVRGLAVVVQAGDERTSAIEITVPAESLSAAELTAELGEPLRSAGRALHRALLDASAGPSAAGLAS